MYLDNIEDEGCRVLKAAQYDLMEAIQEAGYTWGMWVHEGVPGGYVLGSPGSCDETIIFWQFDTNMPVEKLKRVIREQERKVWEAQRCGHAWDCCGCPVLFSFYAFRDMYLGQNYTLVEKWGINI